MRDLSVVIAARNERFLANTVEDVLANARADTEVIVVCDGNWPEPSLPDHPRVTIVHHAESIGQRAAINEGARISQAKYVMKLDAHCAVSPRFDVALMAACQPDWTMIPILYNLHIFDWVCNACGDTTYQGSKPAACGNCRENTFRMVIVWKRRKKRETVSWRFDSNLDFGYWRKHRKRPECQGDLIETMSCNGPCFFMERERFWQLDGVDENHGSWGNFGTELACKAWLSGGKMVTTRKAWFAHLFRTGNFTRNGESPWPYVITTKQINYAKAYSRDLWRHNQWPKAIHPLSWLVEKFWPVEGWTEEDLQEQKERESAIV